MSRSSNGDVRRVRAAVLARRLAESRRFIQVVAGPLEVGKSPKTGRTPCAMRAQTNPRYAARSGSGSSGKPPVSKTPRRHGPRPAQVRGRHGAKPRNRHLTTIEVESGRAPRMRAGTAAFARAFPVHRALLVGADGVPLADFLARPGADWAGR